MNLAELRNIICESASADWRNIPCWGAGSGPSYRERHFAEGTGASLEVLVESHSNIGSYKPDLDISIAWGFDPDADTKGSHPLHFGFEESLGVEDGSIRKCLVDVFYRSALVDRVYLLYVDGGRGLLPSARPRHVAGTPQHGAGSRYEFAVSEEAVNFARAIHSIELPPADFDHYIHAAGFVIED